MLVELVESVVQQTYAPFELVIVSVHEVPNMVELRKLVDSKFTLTLIKSSAKNAPENINFGVQATKSDFVKLLFHDDLLATPNSLRAFVDKLESSESHWVVSSSKNFSKDPGLRYSTNTPNFHKLMALGFNQLGAPSAVMFERNKFAPMNGKYKFLYDCAWYLEMRKNFGEPALIESVEILVRIHENQATNSSKNLRWSESLKLIREFPESVLRKKN
jgi:glycosyltransferase involved in cell wall biosynthesis